MMQKLTKQEEEVMKIIWQIGRCSVKKVVDLLPPPKPPYTTIASIIDNLKRKAYVTQSKEGKAYVYEPAISENDYKKTFISNFVHDYFFNSYKEMVTFFAKEDKLSEQDLKDIIREIENG